VDLALFARTFVLGFTIAAAVGPIALLVMRRTLTSGWAVGMASGVGVAIADSLYGGVAAFGLTAVSDLLVSIARPLGLVGGTALVLAGLGGVVGSIAVPVPLAKEPDQPLVRAGLSTLALTLMNPLTILLFGAIVVSLGTPSETAEAALLTAGFGLGSLMWWLILVSGVTTFRTRLSSRLLRLISIASGVGIATFGMITILGALTMEPA
jgi:threonine/homoserine/homoserine lactone efflux protein